jgi:hypothetical protein
MLIRILIILIGIQISSCTKDSALLECDLEFCTSGQTSYSADIKPLIEAKCATGLGPGTGCHDAWILTYDGVDGRAKNGSIRAVIEDGSMPKVPNNFGIDSLTQAEKELFLCWICDGAPNN